VGISEKLQNYYSFSYRQLPQVSDVFQRRGSKYAVIFSTELGWAFVTDLKDKGQEFAFSSSDDTT